MARHPVVERVVSHQPAIEAALPLINIVFLLLIFFLMAGSLQSPADTSISAPGQTVRFGDTEFLPNEWLYLSKDGALAFQGEAVAIEAIGKTLKEGRGVLFADRAVTGETLKAVLRAYQSAAAGQVLLVTEREREP